MPLQEKLRNKLEWLKATRGVKSADVKMTAEEIAELVGMLAAQSADASNAATGQGLTDEVREVLKACIGPLNIAVTAVQMHSGAKSADATMRQIDDALAGIRALLAAAAAPAGEPLEIKRLKSALAEANQSCAAEHAARELACDELQRRVEVEREDGSRWFWQGDGHDHLESMIDGMQVIIGAAQLRALLAAPAPAAQADKE